jgi:hypothetical protein
MKNKKTALKGEQESPFEFNLLSASSSKFKGYMRAIFFLRREIAVCLSSLHDYGLKLRRKSIHVES